jgi:hypothetical protein
MAYVNLPGIFEERNDGGLSEVIVNNDPAFLVIGTASKGASETFYQVRSVKDAVAAYGKTGTLIRGLVEATLMGAKNSRLYRIGATSFSVSNIGGAITVESILKDDSIGSSYSMVYDDTTTRLRIWRISDNSLVYDNNPVSTSDAVDLGHFMVSGEAVIGAGDSIGTFASPRVMEDADLDDAAVVIVNGTDGVNLSRMKLWEELYIAYQTLEDQRIDYVLPMNVYLDDANVMDHTAAEMASIFDAYIPHVALDPSEAYPTEGATDDALAKVYVEEYEGEYKFWWWFPSSPNADVDATFTSDNGAQIFPSDGSADGTHTTASGLLTGSDFHEVNFAYELANFCYNHSSNVIDCIGSIGVRPPSSYSPKDVSIWVGTLPTYELQEDGTNLITENGTGLMGNKFMAGRLSDVASSGRPGMAVDGIDGLLFGGFYATDSGFLDGTQLKDDNDRLIDIGAYISVVPTFSSLRNISKSTSYVATLAPTYLGFVSSLPSNSSPMNKVVPSVRLPYRVSTPKLDLLAGLGYVTFHTKPKGTVVSDAPTAARPSSDYRRLTTVRIVKDVVDDCRAVAEPFLGEVLSKVKMQALETKLDEALSLRVKGQYLSRYNKKLSATPAQKVNGQAVLELTLVPQFELRQLTVIVALAAV